MVVEVVSVPPPDPRPPRRYKVTCYCGAELECDETDFEYCDGDRSSAFIDCPRCHQTIWEDWLVPLDVSDAPGCGGLLVPVMCAGGLVLHLLWLFCFAR